VIPRERAGPWFGPIAFSGDGRLLALARTLTELSLYDLEARQEVATLTAADPYQVLWLDFSPDGTRLAAATETSIAQIWDLRALRGRLRELEVDWDLPAYPPAPPAAHRPLRIEMKQSASETRK
jgi:WD40 repeat protein